MSAKKTSRITPQPPTRLCYPQAEVAVLLGVSLRTVARFVASGTLPTVTLGGRVMVHADDLAKFARTGTVVEKAEPEAKPKKGKRSANP